MSEDDWFPGEGHGRRRNGISGRIMIIAVLALFVVVIFVIILHLYIRYMLRRQARHRNVIRQVSIGVAAAQRNTQQPPKTGLDPSVIAALPVFVYKKSGQGDDPAVECAVCLSALQEEEVARVLTNCNHTFHLQCIDMWLHSNSTCPICRTGAEPEVRSEEAVKNQQGAAAVDASAPPLEAMGDAASVAALEGTSDGAVGRSSSKAGGSGLRLGSFRKMLSFSRERPDNDQRRSIQSCGEAHDFVGDLERQ